MSEQHEETFRFTARDRLVRAWQNSMELTRDFQLYARELKDRDPKAADLLAEYAEDECFHAAGLRDLLREYET